jgi:hypothetical protein
MDDERELQRRVAAMSGTYPEPEDRGKARLSPLGEAEYVEDLIRPGRIVTWAAEEGSGKSFAVIGELAVRLALAGGSFAGTWPVVEVGAVLVLSEMHSDDDYLREAAVLGALGRQREELTGAYYRLALPTAANGMPALMDAKWRTYITEWCQLHRIKLVVFDTATGATQVEPWGKAIQEVFRNLRVMLDALPGTAVVLVVHCKKPQGRGQRAISDVLGEWGRWCDVVVLQESEGMAGDRAKLSTYKRIRHPRRIVAAKRDGLLVDPVDITEASGSKVPAADVLAAIAAEPGLSIKRLAERLGIARGTARKYVDELPGIVLKPGNRGALTCHLSESVNEGTDTSLTRGSEGDVSPVTPLIEKGVTDMSPQRALFEESEEELLAQLRESRP